MKVIKKLFYAKTRRSDIFYNKSLVLLNTDKPSDFDPLTVKKELKRKCKDHKDIRISPLDNSLLFFFNNCWPFALKSFINRCVCHFSCCTWNKKSEIQQLYVQGKDKIEESIDIIKLIKSIKNLKALTHSHSKQQDQNDEMFKIAHKPENILYLDSSGLISYESS